MRIRKNATGWHARGVVRRDARHDASTSEVPRGLRGKKDRKKWCGGHEGREHELKPIPWLDAWAKGCWKLSCVKCGKDLEHYYFNQHNSRFSDERPAWVPEKEDAK